MNYTCTEAWDYINNAVRDTFYLEVGRVVSCGHCKPDLYGAGLKAAQKVIPNYKCDCVCHDTKDTSRFIVGKDKIR